MNAPLEGIRVLEVANWLAVPAAGALLTDMGAQTVKVEPPGGDPWRNFRLNSPGMAVQFPGNPMFELDNRGKRSLTINLDRPEGQETVRRLAERVDIFLTNLTPSRRERYGLTYADLSPRNPRLIYLGFSGYGNAGPERDRLGFDYAAFWARSGIMSLVGEPDVTPPLQRPGMGDHTTAPLLLAGVLAALYEREKSGRGQEINGSLLNTALWVLGADFQAALVARQEPVRTPRSHAPNPIWNLYRAGDGKWLLLVMPTPEAYWPRVCEAIGRTDLAADPRYSTIEGRATHCQELVAALDAAFASEPRDQWAARLDAHSLIWAPVQGILDAMDDPQVKANDFLTTVEHPTLGPYQTIDTPLKFGRSDVKARGAAPEPGQHTEEVLLEAGYTWDELARLRELGVFGL